MACCPTKVSGRAHCMAARRASLHHRGLTPHPGAGALDRFTWLRVVRLSRLEQVKDVLCAQRRPRSDEMMIRIIEGPTATNRHEARVPNLREDHWLGAPCVCVRPTPQGARGTGRVLNRSVVQARERPFGVVRPGRRPAASALISAVACYLSAAVLDVRWPWYEPLWIPRSLVPPGPGSTRHAGVVSGARRKARILGGDQG